jgi:hypothetical protein
MNKTKNFVNPNSVIIQPPKNGNITGRTPPASSIMAGIIVSISMKFIANARNTACHKNK